MLTMQEISLSFKNQRDDKKFPHLTKIWAYLAERGITRETADALGLHVLPAIELIAAARRSTSVNAADGRVAIVFPHYKLGRREDQIEWWSSRLVNVADEQVGPRLVASFGDFVDPEARQAPKWGKMFCPPNEPPHGYMPPIYAWAGLERGQRVYIHESAIKAVNGCLLGKASVGLNGVWGWCSRKHNVALIEELRDLPWKALALEPVIVFDSNAHDNWQVQAAESALAAKLMEVTGRHATVLRVPKTLDGGDQGFDDYRHTYGDDVARALLEQEGVPADISEIRQMMLQLNTEVCVVRSLAVIADQTTGDLYTENKFSKVLYSNLIADVEDGDEVRQVSAAKAWLNSVDRVEAQNLVYAPGMEKLFRPDDRPGGLPDLNLWRGMGRMPEPGDVEPWLELIANNLADEELRHWLISWCAWPLQHLGAKILSYPLVFGPSGTGKNLLFKPLHSIYGPNAVMISRNTLSSDFNSVYAMRQFVHVDEIKTNKGAASDNVSQRIKFMISAEKVVVNKKGQPEYEVDNTANYAITDNFWDCIKLDQDDRRACVIHWDTEDSGGLDRRGDKPYWTRYVKWAEGMGPSALYQYLLNYDTKDFDPASWAPDTPWKQEVKEAGMTPLESYFHQLKDDPDSVLGLGSGGVGKALFTAAELGCLHFQCSPIDLTPGRIKSIGSVMRNMGFKQAHGGKKIRPLGGGSPVAYWVVRRKDESWEDLDKVKQHLKLIG